MAALQWSSMDDHGANQMPAAQHVAIWGKADACRLLQCAVRPDAMERQSAEASLRAAEEHCELSSLLLDERFFVW
jgi:hypothetical protein